MNPLRVVAVGAVAFVGLGPSMVSAAPSEQDIAWMTAAHQSNLAEIAAGEAAQLQGTSQEVKDLGAMFVEMHTSMDLELTTAAGQLGVTLPGTPTPAQQQQLDSVKAQSGPAFDTAWIAQQIAGHQETLRVTQTEQNDGSDPIVVQLATNAAPVVQQHLTALQSLQGGSPTRIPTGDGGQSAPGSPSPWLSVVLVSVGGLLIVAGVGWMSARRRHV
jgi:putative membrane protein